MKKAIGFWLVTWIFLQGSAQAQSGPGATRLEANNEIPSFSVGALPSQPRTAGEPIRSAPAQQFVCSTGYTQKQCDEEMVVLRKVLAKYPAAQLGTWTWVLVRSEDWKPILQSRGLHPDIPALSDLGQRATFFEEALMGQASVRASHLIERWDMNIDRLLDFAVAHELGHTLCNEKDERQANRVASLLEQRKPVSCKAKVEPKQLSISVHDYADVPTELLAAAEGEAYRIFHQAGVWLNCSPKLEKIQPTGCYIADSTHLVLKVQRHAISAQVRDRVDVLGIATLDEKGVGLYGYVFYDGFNNWLKSGD